MVLNKFNLDGKVAIVTGANTGLGQGMCLALAQAGAKVVGVGRRSCAETAGMLPAAAFCEVIADLSENGVHTRILSEALAAFGRLDILVNNAGIIRRNDVTDFTEQDWDDVMQINLKALFMLSQAAAKQFIAQGSGGKIINIASLLSFQGGIRVPSYTASKSGVRGLTMEMANELAVHNIQVNAIAPGYMVTNNTQLLRADEQRYTEILGRIPAGRWGLAEDMAGT
ncbi:MAG: SDR family NAD(P)-dependent oxidoreductase, partial [Oscillospiraceae bacterium]|nr:SDR family NAD(P)-dependent oxidoreductase [Oscillospiraceae bacterium]